VDLTGLFDQPPWPHQLNGVSHCLQLLRENCETMCVTSPTGGGKTAMMVALIREAQSRGLRVSLYANRNLLMQQLIAVLQKHRVRFGVRAAQYEDRLDLDQPVQISSLDTERSRVYRRHQWDLHDADLVLMDEAHNQKAATAQRAISDHAEMGAQIVGFTATPLGVSEVYRNLVVAGYNSELRKCGALVPAQVFAPDEPELHKIKLQATGEYSYRDIKQKIWTPQIFARVYEMWKVYNPDARPALGFAPGVPESRWFSTQFRAKGVNAAHIDGMEVWVDGKEYTSDPVAREQVIERWRDGDIKVVFNRFVMREGINVPWLYHLILATPIGSLLSYIQIAGRVLRKSPETPDHVVIQDHGGAFWRHGSPNIDRPWAELYDVPVTQVQEMRLDAMREKKEPEPWTCPKCGAVRTRGHKCWQCGHVSGERQRMVLQASGILKPVLGERLKPRRVKVKPNTQRLWDKIFYGSRRSKSGRPMSFKQAEALFYLTYHYYPPRWLANMPRDWKSTCYRTIRDVDQAELITAHEARLHDAQRKMSDAPF